MYAEYNVNNVNVNNVNNGHDDPTQDSPESCRSFCEFTYPTAMFFGWYVLSKTCWCKDSDAGRGADERVISGQICRGMCDNKILRGRGQNTSVSIVY